MKITPGVGGTAAVSGVFFDPIPMASDAPGFVLSGEAVTVGTGSTGASIVTVSALNGFIAGVGLSAANWPAGITGTFANNPTGNRTKVAIRVGAEVAPGSYALVVNGVSGLLTGQTTIALTVTDGPPSLFSVRAAPVTLAAGSIGSSALTTVPLLDASDVDGLITMAGEWPAGITMAPSAGFAAVGIIVAASVVPGAYALPVNVHNGVLNVDAMVVIALTVTPARVVDSSASFVGVDATTQGLWNGKYGGDGFLIANGKPALPAYATVEVTGASTYTWADLTTDVRALQNAKGSMDGMASTYYAKTFSVNVNLSDGATHQVGFYMLDWDSTARVQNITILDTATNSILDQKSVGEFHDGKWVVWYLKGNVTIQISAVGTGLDGVLSGIFFE